MKILLLSRYSTDGASSRVRSFQYIPYLISQGCRVDVSPLFDNGYIDNLYRIRKQEQTGLHIKKFKTQTDVPISMLSKGPVLIFIAYINRLIQLFKCGNYDLIWIEKEIFPWLPAWFEFILSKLSIPYVVDFDDAVFHKYDLNNSKIVRFFLGSKIDAVMQNSRAVIVGNAYLKDHAFNAGSSRIEVIPTVVDLSKYLPKTNSYHNKIQESVFRIGWIGSPSTVIYLNSIEEALRIISSRFNVELVIVGGGEIQMNGVNIVSIPWSDDTEINNIQSFDIGVMPLPNSPYEMGKCGYKLIQYMACGVPAIASPVGANNSIVINGVNGFFANNTTEWIDSIEILISNPAIYSRISTEGIKNVKRDFNLSLYEGKIFSLFSELVRF